MLKPPKPSKLIKKGNVWVTGAWRAHPRLVRIDKVEGEEIYCTFISDVEPQQEASFSMIAFLRTFVPHVETP